MTSTSRVSLAIVAVVALASVGAGATAVGAAFQQGPYEAAQTEVATIDVDLNGTETARLAVGSEGAGYQLNATLVDEDGDGSVAVEFRVPNAGTEDPTVGAVGDDTVENVTESEFHDPPLAPGAYRLSVSADGDQVSDVSKLSVIEPAESATTATTAPATTTVDSSTTQTQTAAERTTTVAATTEESTNGDSPGFGVLAALAAVIGAAALAKRR